MRRDISECRLLRVLIKTLIFDVTSVDVYYLSENPAGDNSEAFHTGCLLRRGLVWGDIRFSIRSD